MGTRTRALSKRVAKLVQEWDDESYDDPVDAGQDARELLAELSASMKAERALGDLPDRRGAAPQGEAREATDGKELREDRACLRRSQPEGVTSRHVATLPTSRGTIRERTRCFRDGGSRLAELSQLRPAGQPHRGSREEEPVRFLLADCFVEELDRLDADLFKRLAKLSFERRILRG